MWTIRLEPVLVLTPISITIIVGPAMQVKAVKEELEKTRRNLQDTQVSQARWLYRLSESPLPKSHLIRSLHMKDLGKVDFTQPVGDWMMTLCHRSPLVAMVQLTALL